MEFVEDYGNVTKESASITFTQGELAIIYNCADSWDGMVELAEWVTPLRVGAICLLTVLVVFSGVYVTGGYYGSPCRDDLAISAYPRVFDVESNKTTVTVTFVEGEPVTVGNSVELFVRISDNDSSNTAQVVWGTNRTGEFPIKSENTLHIDNSSLHGVTLDAGDTVQVGWRGYEKPLPWYCLNERDNDVVTVVYERYVIP